MSKPDLSLPIDEWLEASRNVALLRHVEQLYADLDKEITAQPAACVMKSLCCHFEGHYGHRLYVTAVEACYYLSKETPPPAGLRALRINR